ISEQKAGTRGNIGHLRRPGKPSGSQDPTMWYIATRPALRAQGKKGVRSFPHGLAIPDTGSIGRGCTSFCSEPFEGRSARASYHRARVHSYPGLLARVAPLQKGDPHREAWKT